MTILNVPHSRPYRTNSTGVSLRAARDTWSDRGGPSRNSSSRARADRPLALLAGLTAQPPCWAVKFAPAANYPQLPEQADLKCPQPPVVTVTPQGRSHL